MLFSPVNNRYTPPQQQFAFSNDKQLDDPQYRQIKPAGPIIQTRPYEPIRQVYGTQAGVLCPELPTSKTYLAPERSEANLNDQGAIEYVGKHYSVTDYYEQERNSTSNGWFYTPYYRLTQYIPHLPEYFIVDTTNINLRYTYNFGGITSTALFLAEHIGKILFKRYDGTTYTENFAPGSNGSLGGPSGIYQSLPDPSYGYCATYRPIYNITQKFDLNTSFYRNQFYFRYSPAWLWYEFFPSGGGTSFDGTLTSPTWHIGMPCYQQDTGNTVVWLTVSTGDTSSGTFTITIDGITTAPITLAHGATLVSNIASALAATALPVVYISVGLPLALTDYTVVSLTFSSVVGSPYRDNIPIVSIDATSLIDTITEVGYRHIRNQPSLGEQFYFFPSDWYTYTEGATKEHRKWYQTKPTEQVDLDIPVTGLNRFGGMSTEGSEYTLGSFSPYRETQFYPASYCPFQTISNLIVVLSTTPRNVQISNKKIKVYPVHL